MLNTALPKLRYALHRLIAAPTLACLGLLLLLSFPLSGNCESPREIHDRLVISTPTVKPLALTLDACSGKYDDELIEYLIRNRIPATIFATKKWLDRNPHGVSIIKANLD